MRALPVLIRKDPTRAIWTIPNPLKKFSEKLFCTPHGETSATPLKREALPSHWLGGSGWLREGLPLIA